VKPTTSTTRFTAALNSDLAAESTPNQRAVSTSSTNCSAADPP
jgi:hypothetical protein